MNKQPIIKAAALLLLTAITLSARAQDSVAPKPVHTTPRTITAPARTQKPLNGQAPATVPLRKPAGVRLGTGPVKYQTPTTTTPAATHRTPFATPPASATPYRQPAATPYRAAVPAPANITDKSLSGQYQYLLTRVYGYQRPMVQAFYKNVIDSMAVNRARVKTLAASLSSQNKAVKDLQSDVSSKEEKLDASASQADSISLLGIPMSKSSYNTLMWGLVILFGIIAAVVIIQSGSNRREARYRTKLYDDLDEEYKTYKTKANEKEKKLARELQTVRNKLEEITGNPEY